MMIAQTLHDGLVVGMTLFEFVMNWWLQSTLLIAAGLLAAAAMKSRGAALQSAIYRTTLATALLCPIATGLLALGGWTGWSVRLPASTVSQTRTIDQTRLSEKLSPNQIFEVVTSTEPSDVSVAMTNDQASQRSDTGIGTSPVSGVGPASTISTAKTSQVALAAWSLNGMQWFVVLASAVWVVVAGFLVGRLVRSWMLVNNLRHGSVTADAETRTVCEDVANLIGVNAPDVRYSPYVPSPLLAGCRRPTVLLPEADYPLRLREVLIHELAHLRRNDCAWNLLLQASSSILFFQPLLWVLGNRIEASAEDVCDDYVMRFGGNRVDYAKQLTDIAEQFVPGMVMSVGMLSIRSMLARRVSRVMDGTRTLSTRAGHLLVLLVLFGELAATMTAGFIGLSSTKSFADAGNKPEKTPIVVADAKGAEGDLGKRKQFEGQVIDPTGHPAAGVKLFVSHYISGRASLERPIAKPLTVTDNDGKFHFDEGQLREFGIDQIQDAKLCAVADGYGMNWAEIAYYEVGGTALAQLKARANQFPEEHRAKILKLLEAAGKPLQLRADDQPITAQVVDVNGRPVAGATINVTQLWTGVDDTLDQWNHDIRSERADRMMSQAALWKNVFINSIIPPVTTNAKGEFTIRGLGSNRMAELLIEGPKIESDKFFARTQQGDRIEVPVQWNAPNIGKVIYQPARFIYAAGPSQPIEGTVTDKQTGKPIAGAIVLSQTRHGRQISGWGQDFIRTTTDKNGKYRLEGMPIGDGNRIGVLSPADQPYLSDNQSVKTKATGSASKADFSLHPGVWLTGKITDQQTGKGLSGHFTTFVFKGDPTAARRGVDERQLLRSDANGNFRLAIAKGRGIVGFMADDHENYPRGIGGDQISANKSMSGTAMYFETAPFFCMVTNFHLLKEVVPQAGQDEIHLDLTLDGGKSVEGRVVGADGQPIPSAIYSGKWKEFSNWSNLDGDGTFKILGYDPKSKRELAFYDPVTSLAASVQLTGEINKPLVIKLEPSGKATGRIVDINGEPQANMELSAWTPMMEMAGMSNDWYSAMPLPPEEMWASPHLSSNADGRFEIKGLVPGKEYRVRARGRETEQSRFNPPMGPLDAVIKVKAGESLDLGDVTMVDEKSYIEKVSGKTVANPKK